MSFENKIEIKDLSFSFEKKDIIKNFNQEIIKNEIIGIVGKSGSGKTTLINILMGFLYPSKGKILVDNKDVRRFKWMEKKYFSSATRKYYFR